VHPAPPRTSTAKAAVEGFTRAATVDFGRYGSRVNAVALESIHTERHERYLASLPPEAAEP
jgi:NAD(P)-dependent dehydrogenase (short-subunit alcohol dehydrogenase family)